MRAIVKVGVLWTLGLGVLLAPAVTLALPYKPGKTYCSCGCKTASTTVGLVWELVAHCSLNGHSCKGDGKAGKLETCQKCTAASSTVLATARLQHGRPSHPLRLRPRSDKPLLALQWNC